MAIVTGADGGLGTSVTQALLDIGITVIGTSRKIQASHFDHPSFDAIPADISSKEGAAGLIGQVLSRFGHGRQPRGQLIGHCALFWPGITQAARLP